MITFREIIKLKTCVIFFVYLYKAIVSLAYFLGYYNYLDSLQ